VEFCSILERQAPPTEDFLATVLVSMMMFLIAVFVAGNVLAYQQFHCCFPL